MATELHAISEMDDAESQAYARMIRLQSLAIEQFPSIFTIKDYTDQEGRLVYASDTLLEHLGM